MLEHLEKEPKSVTLEFLFYPDRFFSNIHYLSPCVSVESNRSRILS
jgi:hypothetical protein